MLLEEVENLLLSGVRVTRNHALRGGGVAVQDLMYSFSIEVGACTASGAAVQLAELTHLCPRSPQAAGMKCTHAGRGTHADRAAL